LLMFVFNFGGFLGALLMMGTNIPNILRAFTGSHTIWFSRTYVLTISCAVFLPLSFFKRISSYTINSILSISFLIVLAFMLLYRCIADHHKYPMPENALSFQINLNFLSALGGVSYVFVCHDLSFSVFTGFKGATRKSWYRVTAITMALTVTILLVIGFAGYFMFYQNVQANILDNFPQDDLFANIARILLSLNILTSVPYSVFMPRFSIYSIIVLLFPKQEQSARFRTFFHIFGTVFVLGAAWLISIFVDDLGATFELVGAVSAVSIAYIFPPLMILKLEPGSLGTRKIINIIVLICGISICVMSTTSILYGVF